MIARPRVPDRSKTGWFARQTLILQALACAVVGAFGALGQAPHDHPLALLVALAVGFTVWRAQKSAFACAVTGWAFGCGYFALALFWIIEPFQVDAARHGWMAPFALVFLSGGLALFWALAFWIARLLSAAGIALVFTWTAAEMMRAYVLTGFPWVSPAQAVIDGPASRSLALVGPHGTTLLLMAFAWLLSLQPDPRARHSMRIGQVALLCGAALALYLPIARDPSALTGHWVRLVQPNAAQHLKWHPDHAEEFFRRQLEFTAAAARAPEEAPDLIVWPETAIPWRLGAAAPALATISETAGGRPVALGLLRFVDGSPRNSFAVLGQDGIPSAIYDKHHLVPFGEYMPLRDLAERVGLQALAANAGNFSKGTGPVTLDFGRLGQGMPLICYEAVFAHEINAAPTRPNFLLQVTNDAWFGRFAGPQQHLAQARMRAIEQGLPMVRAANTGISAMIDPVGRVIASIPLNEAGFLDAPLPLPEAPTLYSKIGDLPVVLIVITGVIGTVLRFRHRRKNTD